MSNVVYILKIFNFTITVGVKTIPEVIFCKRKKIFLVIVLQ